MNTGGLPSASFEPEPSSKISTPGATVLSSPASATGAEFDVVTVTVSGGLPIRPSFTTRLSTKSPAASATKVGVGSVALASSAALPVGRDTIDQWKVKGFPSLSLDAVPFNCTVEPYLTLWSAPALATGATLTFSVVTMTVSGALLMIRSSTINCNSYVPTRSATKVGATTLRRSS